MTSKAYFEDIERTLVRSLRSSKESVKICVAWINGKIYAPILQELAQKGVSVEIIYNNDDKNLSHGIPPSPNYTLYPINRRLSLALMHNKFCIIDDSILITGSFNWTRNANDSFENIVVIENELKVVKDFLHEFDDLKAYCQAYSSNSFTQCHCRSNVFNLAILGNEYGKYDESKVDVWSVCVKNNHVTHLGEEYEQHLHTHLGIKDAPDWDDGSGEYDKGIMLCEFRQERNNINSLQNYFRSRIGKTIHAVGVVRMENEILHLKYNEPPEYVVSMLWRDMYYRKIIPEVLYTYNDGVEEIVAAVV